MVESNSQLDAKLGQVRIRPITTDDCPDAYELIEKIYASTEMMCQRFRDKYPTVAALLKEVEEYQASLGSFFLLAENDRGLVAYITVRAQCSEKLAHTAYLNMGVSEGARGQSVGGKMMTAALDRVESDGVIEIVYLTVRADNAPAIRLYESTGFKTITVLSRDTKFNGKYYDALLMRRFVGSLGSLE